MTTITDKTIKQASDHPLRGAASKTGRFLLHLLEMLIAMQAGMMLFHLVLGLLRIFSISRAFESGTTLHALTMTVFMTVPMVAWMIFRGHGWRHCIEMVAAMIAPVALIDTALSGLRTSIRRAARPMQNPSSSRTPKSVG